MVLATFEGLGFRILGFRVYLAHSLPALNGQQQKLAERPSTLQVSNNYQYLG